MMKKLLLLILMTTSFGVMADSFDTNGFYAGLIGGRGYGHFNRGDFDGSSSDAGKNDWTASGRISFGYNIDQYIGIETGYLYFSPQTFPNIANTSSTATLNEKAIDLLTLLRIPFGDSFSAFFMVGSAYVEANGTYDVPLSNTSLNLYAWRPAYGGGVSIDLSDFPGLSLVLSTEVITGNNSINLPTANLYALGVNFHF
jgi:hypothetical protein